jgi:hypothetical protein
MVPGGCSCRRGRAEVSLCAWVALTFVDEEARDLRGSG